MTQSGHHRDIANYRSWSYLSFQPVQKAPIVQPVRDSSREWWLRPIWLFKISGQGGNDEQCFRESAAAVLTAVLALAPSHAVELDPKAVVYQLPDQIKWGPVTPAGNQQAVLFGDPTKPGLYGVLTKWVAGNHFSKPHFHPNDRFITVISGTWWVGSGPNFDPANGSVPMPAGSFVTHYGKQVHWDGAKDVDAVLLIVGNGPAASTPFVSADQLK